ANAEISSHQARIETLLNDIESMSEIVQTSEQKAIGFETSLDRREERIATLETELAATLKVVEGQQQQQRESHLLLTDQQRESDTRLAEQQAASDEFGIRLEENDQERHSLESSLKDRDVKIRSLSDEISGLRADLDGIRQKASNAHQEAQDALDISEKRQQVANSEITDAEQQALARKRDIEDLHANLAQRDQWLQRLKETLEERESRATELQTRVASLEADLQNANEQLRGRQQQHQSVDNEKHELECEIVQQRAKAEQAEAELLEEKQSIAVYKSMVADKEFQLEALELDIRSLKEKLSIENDAENSAISNQALS
ncbi:MAG: hypothetical protein ACC642_02765, partial [Pseudomonadales bacterium]